MVLKRLAVLAAVLLILATPAAQAAGGNGQEVAGTVPRALTSEGDKDARCVECTLGDAVADAARKYLGTDLAIICGGDIKANLLGDLTWDDLSIVFPEDRMLATTAVTVRQLREILEVGVSHIRLNPSERIDMESSVYDGFPQISGFTLTYDASAPVGQRIHEIYVNDEKLALDDDTRTFTLAATAFMLEGGYELPAVDRAAHSDMTLTDVFVRYMNDGMADYRNTGERIRVIGVAGGGFTGLVIAAIIIACVFFSMYRRFGKVQHTRYFRYYPR